MDTVNKIYLEYQKGREYKAQIGEKGLYQQGKINERFYAGDQWHGVQCGNERPLVRYNIIRRIGEYKMASVAGNNVSVVYSAEGVPNTATIQKQTAERRKALAENAVYPVEIQPEAPKLSDAVDVHLATGAMSDYFKVTAERVKFEDLKNGALKNAYVTGTGILYTYWDSKIKTGLYADIERTKSINGDIRCELLDVENVYFGDPNRDDVQDQPYIIIASRRRVKDVRQIAEEYGGDIEGIQPDSETEFQAGDLSDKEPMESKKVLVLTKLWKCTEDGKEKIKCTVVTKTALVRPEYDTRLTLYPIAKISWDSRPNCIYGNSEVTHIIPNQIAVNRAVSAAVWGTMQKGMPIMLVNGDVVSGPVTNDPGQIITVYGNNADISGAVHFVQPPDMSRQFDDVVNQVISQTLVQSGANEAALGDIRPENTSAIMAVQEAATRPLQLLQNRFYSFIEDVAKIWADFWVNCYGNRAIKMEDKDGSWYMPFYADNYKHILLSVKIDVGQAGMYSEIAAINTLDNMLRAGLITPLQYMERMPKGTIQGQNELLQEIKEASAVNKNEPPKAEEPKAEEPTGTTEEEQMSLQDIASMMSKEYAEKFSGMSDEQKQQVAQLMGE